MNQLVRIRAATKDDNPFIFSSWLKSYKIFAKGITRQVYFREHHRLIEGLLKNAETYVAVNAKDDNQIYGWICMDGSQPCKILHFIYVKSSFRNMGIGKTMFELIGDDDFFYTHETLNMGIFSEKGIFSPYLAFWGACK